MKWIKSQSPHHLRLEVPMDGSQFIGLFKGTPCLMQYDDEQDSFYIVFFPAGQDVWRLCREREGKITHYCILEIPEDY